MPRGSLISTRESRGCPRNGKPVWFALNATVLQGREGGRTRPASPETGLPPTPNSMMSMVSRVGDRNAGGVAAVAGALTRLRAPFAFAVREFRRTCDALRVVSSSLIAVRGCTAIRGES